jgi:two-component system, chemotaxis family, sensor histidine kinase and response regulator WspE
MIGLDPAMMELFREEVRSHSETLSSGLLELESDPGNPQRIEPLMRAAHSVKGACRIVNLDLAVQLAHEMEDLLVAAQSGKIRVGSSEIDLLLTGTDLLNELGKHELGPVEKWSERHIDSVPTLTANLKGILSGKPVPSIKTPALDATPIAPIQVSRHVSIARQPIDIPNQPFETNSLFDLFREEMRIACLQTQQAIEVDDFASSQSALRLALSASRIGQHDAAATLIQSMLDAVSSGTNIDRDWLLACNDRLAAVILIEEDGVQAWNASLQELGKTEHPKLVSEPSKVIESVPPIVISKPPVETNLEQAATSAFPTVAEPVNPLPKSEPEAVVRVTAASLNRLMGLAGESLVQARWLQPFATSLMKLKKQQDLLAGLLGNISDALRIGSEPEQIGRLVSHAMEQSRSSRQTLAERMLEFESHAGQAEDLNSRLYHEVIDSRMRPFADGTHGLPRLVRDMARTLGKQVKFQIDGQTTEVDRDILEKLEAPLTHLVRNAVDHGLEFPEDRIAAGKPPGGTIRVSARHRAGSLVITIEDDGCGVNLEKLKKKIVERGLNSMAMLDNMTEAELLEFLFLPGFSTAKQVSEYSGRGVGLDVVQDTIRKVGGTVRITTVLGKGTKFHLQLPITLSVIRAVIIDIAGEPFALPHNRIDRLVRVPRNQIQSIEHRQFVTIDGQNIGLVLASQLLELTGEVTLQPELSVVLLGDHSGVYGLVVDAFHGEQDLVVRPLDTRLGKIPNLSAAAILDDGVPILIVDVEDLVRSMDQYIQTGSLRRCETVQTGVQSVKRILVVDDSVTVREVERQLLLSKGYEVTLAFDGMDGWNRLRADKFDLLISDVDMPRMTGLQLVKLVRQEDRFKDLPIIIVSYKEREEDRLAGLEVGANYYLTKSSFHDNRFLEAVEDLIGQANS